VDLVTYRKDGRPVHTPVLSTSRGATLLIRTHDTAGKLKRLRNNPAVEVAPCDGRGRLLGPVQSATARILAPTETDACLELLHRRHGLVGRLATAIRHLRGMGDVFLEVDLS
jgi:PPOX class probable F420-dependent enzyme